SPALRDWFEVWRNRAAALLGAYHRPKPRKVEQMLGAVHKLCSLLLERGLAGLEDYDEEGRETLGRDLGSAPVGWTKEHFDEAGRMVDGANLVLTVDHRLMADLL